MAENGKTASAFFSEMLKTLEWDPLPTGETRLEIGNRLLTLFRKCFHSDIFWDTLFQYCGGAISEWKHIFGYDKRNVHLRCSLFFSTTLFFF